MSLIRCTCYTKDHGYVFNEHPGVKCRKHPHCLFDHAEYNSILKMWTFPKANTFELGGAVKQNGIIDFKVRCTGCGKTSGSVKKDDFVWLIERGIRLTWMRERYANADTHVCQVKGCGSTAIEWHHVAPRSVFGEDAESWPIIPACRKHHVGWHQTMTGYTWNGRGRQ